VSQILVEALIAGCVAFLVLMFIAFPMARRARGDKRRVTQIEWLMSAPVVVIAIGLIIYFIASGMRLSPF
jgi:formate hydrogenlyase subunit 3/multisubunit Na+/H+ antiporter MnhD subunit